MLLLVSQVFLFRSEAKENNNCKYKGLKQLFRYLHETISLFTSIKKRQTGFS